MKILIFAFLSLTLIACNNKETSSNQTSASSTMLVLNKEQFNKKLASTPTAQLIDVRTPEEFAAGAIPNAINIDFYADDFDSKMLALKKDAPVFLYCKSGGRSGKTAKKLSKAYFKEVYDLKGGYSNWSK